MFVLSRAMIAAAVLIAPFFVPARLADDTWELDDTWLRPLFRWDTGWYLSIAEDGYTYDGDPTRAQNIGFFPAYSLACGLVHRVTGLGVPLSGILLSNAAFLAALFALYGLTLREAGPAVAKRTVTLVCLYPGSLFCSIMYTESFFLLFSVLAFLLFRRGRFVAGGLCAGVVAATRFVGVLLVVPLLIEAFTGDGRRVSRGAVLLGVMLAGSGLAGFCVYQWVAFDDPFIYFRIQRTVTYWRGGFTLPFSNFEWAVRQGIKGGFSAAPFDAWLGVVFIAASIGIYRRLGASYCVYALLSIAVPLSTGAAFVSLTRYLAVLFPGFMGLSMIGQSHRWMRYALPPLFGVSLALFAMHYAQWHWVG